jgi:hypothetical protein
MLSGFSFAGPGVAEQLGAALAPLAHYNGLPVPDGYFEPAMERLRDFLEVPLEEVEHPTLVPPSELPLDPMVCLVARISMMTMLPISIAPNSTAYILSLSNKTPTMGFMEIGNGAREFSQWPSPGQMNGLPPEFALGCTLSNAIEKALVNVRLVFQVHYRLPRPGGGVVAADPIERTLYPRATVAMIHPYKTFQFVIANRSQTQAAEVSLSTQAVIQIAGESAPRRILMTRPEVSIVDMLGSNILSPTRIAW